MNLPSDLTLFTRAPRGRRARDGAMRGVGSAHAPVSAFGPAGLAMFATMAAIVSDDGVSWCALGVEGDGSTKTKARGRDLRLAAYLLRNIALSRRGAGSAEGTLRGAHRGYRIRAQLSRRMSALSSASALRASVHLGARPRATARKSARGAVTGLNAHGVDDVRVLTNRDVAATLKRAHERGFKTIGLTVGPWGAEHDKRWRGGSGNRYQNKTRLTVDFLMGRLTPQQAFGRSAEESFLAGQLPDIAVDLYDSGLRDADAALRDEAPTRRRLRYDKELRRALRKLPKEEQDAAMEREVAQALEMPRWFMKKELQAFDHIHPNMEGHRVIAQAACPSLPESWGCQCARLPELSWDRKARALLPVIELPARDPAPPAEAPAEERETPVSAPVAP